MHPTHIKKLQFIPLGGLSEKLITEYITEDFVLAIGGSWITNKELIKAKDWAKLPRMQLMLEHKLSQ